MRNLADLFQILGQPADQMPGLLVVIVAEGELLQMVEGGPAHIGLDIDAEHMSPIGDDRHQSGIDRIDEKQRRRGKDDQHPLLRRQKIVDEQLHRHRETEFQKTRKDRTGEIEDEQSPVGAVIFKKATKHPDLHSRDFDPTAIDRPDKFGET